MTKPMLGHVSGTGPLLATLLAFGLAQRTLAADASKDAKAAAEIEKYGAPLAMLDESAPDWLIDRFVGNSGAGSLFAQGPARQAAGLYNHGGVTTAPDGSVYLTGGMENRWSPDRIVQVTPDGTLHLLAGGGASLADGPASKALIRAEGLDYCQADKSLYFCHRSIPCIRRLYQKGGQWFVETVAGDPEKGGAADGQGRAALFEAPRKMAITSTGIIYVLDGLKRQRLVKVERGLVTTVVKFNGGQKNPVDGPYDKASLAITDMCGEICLGENDNTIYVADHWQFAVRKIDLKAGTITTVAGMPAPKEWKPEKQTPTERRYTMNADGEALTQASVLSGCAFVRWDPVRSVLWFGGPDEERVRRLKDGFVKSVMHFKSGKHVGAPPWGTFDAGGLEQNPPDAPFVWAWVKAVDHAGNLYIEANSDPTGIWRAYRKASAK